MPERTTVPADTLPDDALPDTALPDTASGPVVTRDPLATARDLVAALVPDDVHDAAPDEDLRDLGLDSVRLLGLVESLRSRGTDVDTVDLAVEPTLARIAALLA